MLIVLIFISKYRFDSSDYDHGSTRLADLDGLHGLRNHEDGMTEGVTCIDRYQFKVRNSLNY